MEAATPLRPPHVRTHGNRLAIDGLVIDDECAVRLVREREEAGGDAAKLIADAVEIGARVLDREQTGANAEFVRNEFEKVSREVEGAFSDKARVVAEHFGRKVDEVFNPDAGYLSKALDRHFSDESSAAVQHRVRQLVADLMTKQREDLLKHFSAADASNPLADFKSASLAMIRQASDRQDVNLRALLEKLAALEKELQGLRDERDKQLQLEVERDRGTAKGRAFEELVADAVDAIAHAQGDACDAVGDLKGGVGKVGDVVVEIDACRGPARGRIVFEAKNSRLSRPAAIAELDRALRTRDADFAVLVVPNEDKLPSKLQPLREYNGDKLVVVFDPDEPRLPLEVAYSLGRARVLMARGDAAQLDAPALRDLVERALATMDDVRKIKSQLTGATTSIDTARTLLETMTERVRDELHEIDALVAAASAESAPIARFGS